MIPWTYTTRQIKEGQYHGKNSESYKGYHRSKYTLELRECMGCKEHQRRRPKYSVSLIIPKSDTVTVNKIKAAIEAAYEEGQSKLKGNGKTVPASLFSRHLFVMVI